MFRLQIQAILCSGTVGVHVLMPNGVGRRESKGKYHLEVGKMIRSLSRLLHLLLADFSEESIQLQSKSEREDISRTTLSQRMPLKFNADGYHKHLITPKFKLI